MMGGENLFLYHSDDGLFCMWCLDGMLAVEIDISSCDSSCSVYVFNKLREFIPKELLEDYDVLVEQCEMNAILGWGPDKLKFKPDGPFLFSGSLLTTCLNNVALLCIFLFINDNVDYQVLSRNEARNTIEKLLKICGWKVTCDYYDNLAESSFLKTFCVQNELGGYDACLCLGVTLRAMGQTKKDLPGRGCVIQRAEKFMRDWALGLRHAGRHPLNEMLEQKWSGGDQAIFTSRAMENLHNGTGNSILLESLVQRYGITNSQFLSMVHGISQMEVGSTYADDMTRIILRKDY